MTNSRARARAPAHEDLILLLADLYLDTDVRDSLPRLAQQIVRSGITEHELSTLWRSQLTPSVHWNLKAVAGEQSSFDRRWLLHEVSRREGKRGIETLPWLGKLVHRLRAGGAEREFQLALELSRRLAQVPEAQREQRVVMWLALTRVYYATAASADESARHLVESQRIEPHALVEEFRVLCDVLSELLTDTDRKSQAEAHVAAWLERLGLDEM